MAISSSNRLTGFVKLLIDVIFILGILIFLTLPLSLKYLFGSVFEAGYESYAFMLVFLYVTGILSLLLVYEGKKILGRLYRRNPFVVENVISFKRVAYYSFLIAIAFAIKIAFFITILTVVVAFVFFLAGLFSLILSQVFAQAVAVKEENDLTI
jgi:membrane protease YdiL (CAAX protease family)